MKKQLVLLVVAFSMLGLARTSRAGLFGGAEIHAANFFILPGGTGLSTKTNFGLGSVNVGYSLADIFSVSAFLAQTNTGTISGSGNLFGSSGTFSGKFKILSYGVEGKLAPPFFPLYLRLGLGLGSLTSDFTFNGSSANDPFDALKIAYQAHLGTGVSIGLPLISIFAGLDAVYVKIKQSSTSTSADVSRLLYFRAIAGVTYSF